MNKSKEAYAFEETHKLSSLDIIQFMTNERPHLILVSISLKKFAPQQSKDTSLLEKIENTKKGLCFRLYMSILIGCFHYKWNHRWYKVVSHFPRKKWISGQSRNLPQWNKLPVRIVEIFQHTRPLLFCPTRAYIHMSTCC